jgi:uncharacterized protein
MHKKIQLQLSPAVAFNEQLLKEEVAQALQLQHQAFLIKLNKRSIDARSRNIKINLTLDVFIDEIPVIEKIEFPYHDISHAKKPVILLVPVRPGYLLLCVV